VTVTVEEPWTVQPDESSTVTINSATADHNIVLENDYDAHAEKGAIIFYSRAFDNVVSNNRSRKTGGIWLSGGQLPSQGRLNYSYFNRIVNNDLRGGAKNSPGHHREQNHLVLGPANDGGTQTWVREKDPAVVMYGNEYRENYLEGRGTDAQALSPSGKKTSGHLSGSGVMISSAAPVGVGQTAYDGNGVEKPIQKPLTQGTIVQGNDVNNTIAGIHLNHTSYDTVLRGNDFTGNGTRISSSKFFLPGAGYYETENYYPRGSVRSLRIDGGDVLPALQNAPSATPKADGNTIEYTGLHADSYEIASSDVIDGEYETVHSPTETTVTGSDHGPAYRITPINDAGRGLPFRLESRVEPGTVASPSQDIVSASYEPGTGISVEWQAVEAASAYLLERSQRSDRGFETVTRTTDTSVLDEAVSTEATYYYRVRSVTDSGAIGPDRSFRRSVVHRCAEWPLGRGAVRSSLSAGRVQ
jgi:hypothetical protein